MKPRFFAATALAGVVLVGASINRATANIMPVLSLEEKVKESDAVLVGIATTSRTAANGYQIVRLRVVKILKGDVAPEIDVVSIGNTPEQDPGLFCSGATYLVFLERGKYDDLYYAVSGQDSKYILNVKEGPPSLPENCYRL